ncbi:DNA adenine methylase [Dyadobacter sp. 22481]|uniref:DNA adenine methylase n=1 Tax=Dyadobacter sp. 22481 TaxID=3453926 RepID=UPI003F8518AA
MKLKTPITYYGGKQKMAVHILPLIPEHFTYVEPFFGGGAIFFAKRPSPAEVVNDINHQLVNFYKVLKYDFDEIERRVDETFHSRQQHRESGATYFSQADQITDPVSCAWAVWMQANMSFASKIGAGFGYDRRGKTPNRLAGIKSRFTHAYQQRLKRVTIENYDALKVIRAYDSPDTFFYLDPPYVSSDQGHYEGYSMDDFRQLLDACAIMQGKFLLSSYPEQLLLEYRERLRWESQDFEKWLTVDTQKVSRKKVECLTWNY